MRNRFTILTMLIFLFLGTMTSSAQYFTVSTESSDYVYFIKGAASDNNTRYWKYDPNNDGGTSGTVPAIVHTTDLPTADGATLANYQFKIYASSTANKYYIYSVGAGQYLAAKETTPTAGQDKVTLSADKTDACLWYIPNDGTTPNGIIDIVPGALNLNGTQLGWNIHGGVSYTKYIGLYDRSDGNSKWSLIPADLSTLNAFRTQASALVYSSESDYYRYSKAILGSFPTADYTEWTLDAANTLVSSIGSLYPSLPTGYYTIKNCATDSRPKYIYADRNNNPNGYTLQSSSMVTDSKGIWKVTNNGSTVTIMNSNGDPITAMVSNAPSTFPTLNLSAVDGKEGIYFTQAINASNRGFSVNDINCLTTWTTGGINASDNRWVFYPVAETPYDVIVSAPVNYALGWRYPDTETSFISIKNGGFFADPTNNISNFEFALLDQDGNVVDGVNPVIDSENHTITATLSELPSGYYRIVSAYTGGTSASKSITSFQTQSNKLGWEVTDANNGEQYWNIQGNSTDGYTIQSAYFGSKQFIKLSASSNNGNTNYSLVSDENEASHFNIALIASSNQYTLQATDNNYPVHGQYMSDSWSAGPLTTWAGEKNSASAWYLYPTTDLEVAVASLTTFTSGIDYSKQVGTALGQYSEPEGTTTEGLATLTANYITYKQQVTEALASNDVATMETAFNNFKTNVSDLITAEKTAAYATLTINQPTVGKLYRFKGKANNKYMAAASSNAQMTMVSNADLASTIFIVCEGNAINNQTAYKLLSYNTGYYTKETRANGALADAANSVLMKTSEGNNSGYYTLYTDYSGSKYIYDNNTVVDRNGTYKANNCDWTIEEVTWLPIPVSSTYRFGTFFSPVNIALTDQYYEKDARMKFYTGRLDNEGYVVLDKVNDNIPANTPYVIELTSESGYGNGCQYLKIADSAPAIGVSTYDLRGGLETIATPTDQGTIYTLQAAWDDNTDDHNSATDVAFRIYNGTNILGCRAYLPVSDTQSVKGLRFNEGTTTRIESLEAGQTHEIDAYDLSGRRVKRAGKGLYIINGKKFYIK
ncbi:MAG: hypothetical protein PUF44_00615 [Bacteroidales bacterium]|nr:hypothetical protein [Bacteroidales bacterium]